MRKLRPPRPAALRRLSRRRVAVLSAAVLVVGGGGGGAWLLTRDAAPAAAASLTATVASQTVEQTVSASGTIAAAATADLDFAVSGTVTRVYVSEGDTVRKGQILARVDDSALVASRTAAAAALTAAYAQLSDDVDADASSVQVASDQAAILAAKADYLDAKGAVGDAVLRATIKGTVTSLDLERGDVVGSSSTAGGTTSGGSSSSTTSSTTSTSAVQIVSSGRYVVDTTVAASDVEQVSKGLQAEITATGVDDTLYGTVTDVGLVAETSSSGAAVFPVTITVTGKQKDLYAGTSADVSIVVKKTDGVLTVPSRALHNDGDTTYVEKIVDGDPVRTTVTVGQTYGMNTEITQGLAEGDVVQLTAFTAPTGGGTGEDGEQGGFPSGEMPDFGGSGIPGGGFAGGQG